MNRFWGITCLVALLAGCGSSDDETSAAGRVDDGRRIYREGVLPNGDPVTAIVAGDVPIVGTQFSCESCHGRSGMGTGENEYIVPPVAGPFLFSESPQPARPAYTMDSLATVLRDGITPSGRQLKVELMPLYRIDDSAMQALSAYLETLSAGNSPGVSDSQIHFATVIAGSVDESVKEGVLDVIRQFFDEKNRQTRLEGERWDRGYTPESRLPSVFREWVLDEWVLTGPPDTWETQLGRYYEQQPVFALVSGLADGSWSPIGRFCQQQEIPCLYPVTDRPWVDPDNYYTLHFSRGLGLEADLIANHLSTDPPSMLVQVYCDEDGEWAADQLRDALTVSEPSVDERRVECDLTASEDDPVGSLTDAESAAAVFWVSADDIDDMAAKTNAGRVYVSSIFMGGDPGAAAQVNANEVYMVHAKKPPGQLDAARQRFGAWAKSREVAVTAEKAQAEAFYACMVLGDAVRHIGRFYIRDFVMDMLEHAQGLLRWVPYHARATIGPRQRFLTKGGYIIPIVDGEPDTSDLDWVIP